MSYTGLRAITNVGEPQLINEMENGLKEFFEWGLLNCYNWSNVTYGATDIHGNRMDILKPVSDDNYTDGQVWQTFRKELVYESGLSTSTQPIGITGVTISGDVVSAGYNVDYRNGLVIFDDPIDTTATVQMEFSYKYVQVNQIEDVPWLKKVQYDSFNVGNVQWTQLTGTSAGEWDVHGQNRIQLPAIIIEATTAGAALPYELGDNASWINQDINFYILAENSFDRNNILDAIRNQHDESIFLFDSQSVRSIYPLDYNNYKVNNNLYTDLVSNTGARGIKCRLKQCIVSDIGLVVPSEIHAGVVRVTCEAIQ